MLNVIHISDLHFGEPFVPRVAQALHEKIHQFAPDLLVVSGDLTQRAKVGEFVAARDFLQTLPAIPQIVVPGNHDVPLYRFHERLFTPYRLYERYISAQRNYVIQRNDAVVVALDTSNPHRFVDNGRIRPAQLELLTQAFDAAAADATRIVVMHHHLAPSPDYDRSQTMPGAKKVLDVLIRHRVDLILAGHIHRAYVGNSLDIYAGEDRDHGIIIVHCGTSTSRRGRAREREKNSFNQVTVSSSTITVVHYLYFDDNHAFQPVARHEFARAQQRYLHEPKHAA
jgi:3',5'-cyclic AMP phosphodiesterase CpdA